MPRSRRDHFKRACAQTIEHIERSQATLSIVWKELSDDGRKLSDLASLDRTAEQEQTLPDTLTGAEAVNAMLLSLEATKLAVAELAWALWRLSADDLKIYL